MAAKERGIEWFGADVEEQPGRKRTVSYLPGFKGVDADVPRVVARPDGTLATELARKPAPRHVTVTTTARDHEIGRLTARHKLMRSAFQFAPASDKDKWRERMDIAFAEMQVARFKHKLARYQERPNPRPEQVDVLRQRIAYWYMVFAELTGQDWGG